MSSFLFTLVVGFFVWFWLTSLKTREIAVGLAKQAAQSSDVQFLDDTVVLNKIGLGRTRKGTLAFQRVYAFEFALSGEQRYTGQVAMQGKVVTNIYLDHPEGALILHPQDFSSE